MSSSAEGRVQDCRRRLLIAKAHEIPVMSIHPGRFQAGAQVRAERRMCGPLPQPRCLRQVDSQLCHECAKTFGLGPSSGTHLGVLLLLSQKPPTKLHARSQKLAWVSAVRPLALPESTPPPKGDIVQQREESLRWTEGVRRLEGAEPEGPCRTDQRKATGKRKLTKLVDRLPKHFLSADAALSKLKKFRCLSPSLTVCDGGG